MTLPDAHPTRHRLDPALRSGLEAIYRDLDERVARLGVACRARGICCDFDRMEHRLYSSSVETEYVLETRGAELTDAGGVHGPLCPFWKDGLCTERERRPLGCRTYFCDARYRDALEALHEEAHGRLRLLAREHDAPWLYAPFVDALAAATRVDVDRPPRGASTEDGAGGDA